MLCFVTCGFLCYQYQSLAGAYPQVIYVGFQDGFHCMFVFSLCIIRTLVKIIHDSNLVPQHRISCKILAVSKHCICI